MADKPEKSPTDNDVKGGVKNPDPKPQVPAPKKD